MHVIVLYATTEGQTRKIARSIAGTVQSCGHDTSVYDATELADLDPDLADALIVAAPVHIGKYPAALTQWLAAKREKLANKPSAFVSVSLGAASEFEEEHREIAALTNAMFDETGWTPGQVHYAAGALRYTRYDFLKKLLMRYISAKEGGDTDTTQDHEYTDWRALGQFVTGFIDFASKG